MSKQLLSLNFVWKIILPFSVLMLLCYYMLYNDYTKSLQEVNRIEKASDSLQKGGNVGKRGNNYDLVPN